jgi:hypothetical protein
MDCNLECDQPKITSSQEDCLPRLLLREVCISVIRDFLHDLNVVIGGSASGLSKGRRFLVNLCAST